MARSSDLWICDLWIRCRQVRNDADSRRQLTLPATRYYSDVQISYRALIVAACTLSLAGCDRGNHPRDLGKPAPDFTVYDGAQTLRLADYRGRVVVLNFWATWCQPCIEELPSLTALQRAMPSVQVLAVSTDDDRSAYKQFLIDHPIHLLTIEDAAQRSNALYGTHRFPETYVIDRRGVIRRKFIGAQDWTSPEILEYLSKL